MGAVESLTSVPMNVFGELTDLGPDWLAERRRAAISTFETTGFPTKRWEMWKHIDLTPVLDNDFRTPSTPGDPGNTLNEVDGLLPNSPRVVFVDGRFDAGRSRLDGVPKGVTVQPLAEALKADDARLRDHLAVHANPANSPFIALNTALMSDGVFIAVDAGAMVETPVVVVNVATAAAAGHTTYPRIVIHGGEASQLTVVEWHGGVDGSAYLNCAVTEMVAEAGAQIDTVRIAQEGDQAYAIGGYSGTAARDARVGAHSFVCGGQKVRLDMEATVNGDNGEGDLTGIHLSRDRQFVDHHTWVHHDAEHTRSRQVFKGILTERSETVFDGLIKVHPGAQKTDAEQENRNLVLSNKALAHSDPRLEIYADDVRCTHGSTVGELDEDAIFYLRSRGIDPDAAKGILTYAFANDVLEHVRCEEAAAFERAILRAFLPGGRLMEGLE